MSTLTDRQDLLLQRVADTRRRLNISRQEWTRAVLAAWHAGVPITRIASRSGLTEAAIRMKLKRDQESVR